MIYAFVKDGQILQGPTTLPTTWENVTGLDKADAETLRALGWLPVIPGDLPVINDRTHKIESRLNVTEDSVIEEFHAVELDTNEQAETLALAWSQVRYDRDAALAASDWTELPSVRAQHTAEWAAAWDAYRQALRDITKQPTPWDISLPQIPS